MDNNHLRWNGAAVADGLTTHGTGSDGSLTISCERLAIDSKVGTFSFLPGEILDASPAGLTPWLGAGLMIRHVRTEYPAEIGFCPRGISSKNLIKLIAEHGFISAKATAA